MSDRLHVSNEKKKSFIKNDTVVWTIECTDVQYHSHQYILQEKNSAPSGLEWASSPYPGEYRADWTVRQG